MAKTNIESILKNARNAQIDRSCNALVCMNKLEQWTIVTFMPEAIFHKNFSIIISKYNNYYRPINFKMNEVQTTEYIHISAAFPPISHSQCPLFLFEANFVYCVPVIEPVNHSHSQKVSEIVWSTAHTAIK